MLVTKHLCMQTNNTIQDNDKRAKQSKDTVTPAQTGLHDDIDETVERQDEYNKFNKDTVPPHPQIQQNK
jgi:hypothetical protein